MRSHHTSISLLKIWQVSMESGTYTTVDRKSGDAMHTNIEPAAPYPCLVIYLDQTLFSSAACQEFTAAQVRIDGPTQPFMARPCCQTTSPNPVRVMNVSLCNLIRLQNGATPANDSCHHNKQGAGGFFFPPTLSATSSARLPVHHTKKTTGARQIQNSAAHPPRHSRALCPRSASLFPLGVQHARHLDQADMD